MGRNGTGIRGCQMHELSVASRIIEITMEHLDDVSPESVRTIVVHIGALTCIHNSSLTFCFEVVAKENGLQNATLKIVDIPVTIYCAPCHQKFALPGIQRFRCPSCDAADIEIRHGNELEIDHIELLELAKTSAEIDD